MRPSKYASLFVLLFVQATFAADHGTFRNKILPLLTDNCLRCHGPDEETQEAGLRLDEFKSATAELDSGSRAIVPGDPNTSELIARITTDDEDLRMPPLDAGTRLSDKDVSTVRAWIADGAVYARHWSFDPPKLPPIPAKSPDSTWAINAIDHFVLARLEKENLIPQTAADRPTLLRRVSLDLTGLPPSIEDVDRFVTDDRRHAYESAIDRLMDSPAYGERWARVWLDMARYADSAGYAQDPLRTIWRYRDWVIDSINHNKPFDQFTIEQIAGDMLPNATEDQILATAFHRNTMTNSEGGTDDEEFRNAAVVDRVNTTMEVWMGMTMGCAQCHTHKYDPITQEEYFQFFAVFNNTEDADRGDERPLLAEYSQETLEERTKLQHQIKQVAQDSESEDRTKELQELKNALAKLPATTTPIMRELPTDKRRSTFVQVRGNFRQTGTQVTAGVPSAFHKLNSEANRLSVARWLVDEQNPLAARVVVNRYWESLFGIGIVETSEDFGLQGEPPSHPELLDYLAVKFMEHGWDTKWLVRTIVTSATYRQSSAVTKELAAKDPQNRLLARGPRFRLSAEMLRDQALAISGLLSRKTHGPSVRPPRPNLGLRSAFGGSTDWQTSTGEDRYRRGIYTRWRRTTPYPAMATFDAPSREVCTIRRIRTNTPLQALVTLNDPVYIEAAQALARHVIADCDSLEDRATTMFRRCVARFPTAIELQRMKTLLNDVTTEYVNDSDSANAMATDPIGPAPDGIEIAELAAWTVLGNVLLNLDETVARP